MIKTVLTPTDKFNNGDRIYYFDGPRRIDGVFKWETSNFRIIRDLSNSDVYSEYGVDKSVNMYLANDTRNEAVKHDEGKPDLSYMTYELISLHAKVREFGAKKYSRNNWKKGFKVTRSLAAALRHLFKFIGGEDNDPESGINHLGHALCCIEHAYWDYLYHKENDNRAE